MSKHNQIIDTVDECITAGIKNKILHLTADDGFADGRTIQVNGKTLVNFASYSYLGLEVNPKLKEGGIKAIQKYGTQFGASRAYVSIRLYEELENLFSKIFEAPVIVAPSTTLAHQAAIPVLVRDEDVVIIDQHVHASVQMTVKMLQARRIPVELLRHNNLERLEERIKELKNKFRKVWYMLDGVYSMYGDYAPLHDLNELLNRHEQLQIYVDDAHGMSWAGKYGSGYVLSQINLHPQMILVTSLNKAFAGAGGAIIFPDHEQYRKVRTCGGTLIFSTPIQPPMLGVNVASAEIHLSNEIKILQLKLLKRIEYFNMLVKKSGLPLVSKDLSPIFYIGLGKPRVGYNMVRRLMNEGFYLSIGLFPAVSMKCSGLRCCVNVHQSLTDIQKLVDAVNYHLPLALAEEGIDRNDVHMAFNLPLLNLQEIQQPPVKESGNLNVECFTTIHSVSKTEWDSLLGGNGSFDWEGLAFLEDTYCDNPKPENNWSFHYFIIRDNQGKPVIATFFTVALCKDDIFSPASVSETIEKERKLNPYYLCSKALMMGSLLTEGQHLYIDKSNKLWQDAFLLLLERLSSIQESAGATMINLRDFEANDPELHNLLLAEGYVKIDLPEANIITGDKLGWDSVEKYLERLSPKSRSHLRRDALRYEQFYDIEIVKNASEEEISDWYELYKNVETRTLTLNTFLLPKKAFRKMLEHPNWEIVRLTLKKEYDDRKKRLPVAIGFNYKTEKTYCPMLLGLDYFFLFSYKNYKQLLFQAVKRANELGSEKLFFGFTANIEKRKFGAVAVPKIAYIQTNDGFNMQVLEMSRGNEGAKV